MRRRIVFLLGFILVSSDTLQGGLPAFPGAEGFGAETPGGRGGKVLLVTNLEDSGPGSLRAAVETEGPRIVLFRVSGTIRLKSKLKINKPFLTIAGQSAPGDGICLADEPCTISTHDVVVRFLRFRPGDRLEKELDALSVQGENIVIDHCSTSWGIDETLSVTHGKNITVQWCLITESLNRSHHKKGEHGYGSLIAGPDGGISFHHNVYAHHRSRNPRPGGYDDTPGITLDFRNNVIYNWGDTAGYNNERPLKMNYVGNYLKAGPSTKTGRRKFAFIVGGDATRIFLEGNVMAHHPEATRDNARLLGFTNNFTFPPGFTAANVMVREPFPAPPVATQTAEEALAHILTNGGAVLPRRDPVDARVLESIIEGSGKIIDSQEEVGAWPKLASSPPPLDTDQDGMPDEWEISRQLDPNDSSDHAGDRDADGYTNIEEYLNALAAKISE